MTRSRLVALSFIAFATAPFGASATTAAPAERVTPWTGGQLLSPSGGSAYCAIEAGFANGLMLSFAQAPDASVTLAVGIPDLPARKTSKWMVTLALHDDGLARWEDSATASVVDRNLLAIPLKSPDAFRHRGDLSPTFTLSSASDQASFRLSKLGEALDKLQACAQSLPKA